MPMCTDVCQYGINITSSKSSSLSKYLVRMSGVWLNLFRGNNWCVSWEYLVCFVGIFGVFHGNIW